MLHSELSGEPHAAPLIGIQNPKEEYKISNEIEILNSNVYRMQQYYKGIQVLGRQMVMATDKEGNICKNV